MSRAPRLTTEGGHRVDCVNIPPLRLPLRGRNTSILDSAVTSRDLESSRVLLYAPRATAQSGMEDRVDPWSD